MKRILKNLLFSAFLLVLSGTISAQAVNSGAWMVGGSLGFNSIKYENDDATTNEFNVSPNIGYYIINNLAAGIRTSLVIDSYDGNSETYFGIGPWARLYVFNHLFVQTGIDFGASQFDLYSFFNSDNSTTFHVEAGFSWFLNPAVAIEPVLTFNSFNGDEELFEENYTRFGVNLSVQAFIGRSGN